MSTADDQARELRLLADLLAEKRHAAPANLILAVLKDRARLTEEMLALREHFDSVARTAMDNHNEALRLRARVAELERERDELAKKVYVPGLWKCAKCGFTLVQRILRASDGAVGIRDEAGDRCPNDGSPLWRVSERDAGNEMVDRCEEQVARAVAAEQSNKALTALLDRADKALESAGEFVDEELENRECSFPGPDGQADDPDAMFYVTDARNVQSEIVEIRAAIKAAGMK